MRANSSVREDQEQRAKCTYRLWSVQVRQNIQGDYESFTYTFAYHVELIETNEEISFRLEDKKPKPEYRKLPVFYPNEKLWKPQKRYSKSEKLKNQNSKLRKPIHSML